MRDAEPAPGTETRGRCCEHDAERHGPEAGCVECRCNLPAPGEPGEGDAALDTDYLFSTNTTARAWKMVDPDELAELRAERDAATARADAADEAVAKVRELHYERHESTSDEVWGRPGVCAEDGHSWPCRTIAALPSEPADPGSAT